MGFSDARLAVLAADPTEAAESRARRQALGVRPVFKTAIDNCCCRIRFPPRLSIRPTNLRSQAAWPTRARRPTRTRSSFSAAGPIGSARASSSTIAAATPASHCTDVGYETIMINCNPETVSNRTTNTADRLYFRAVDIRGRARIIATERQRGHAARRDRQFSVVRTPAQCSPMRLEAAKRADPRHFADAPLIYAEGPADQLQALADKLHLKQPTERHRLFVVSRRWLLVAGRPRAAAGGFRPSYVLGGPRHAGIIREEKPARRLPARHLAGAGCRDDVKARYPTTRPGTIKHRCSAPIRCLFRPAICPTPSRSTSTGLCDGKGHLHRSAIMEHTRGGPAIHSANSALLAARRIRSYVPDDRRTSSGKTRELALGLDVVVLRT